MNVTETMKAITGCAKKLIEAPRYNVGDFVGVYEYETDVRIHDIRWEGSCFVYKVYLADEETWLYDEDIAYKKDEMIEGLVEEETLIERVDDNGLPFNEWLSHKGAFHVPDGYELKDENGNVINATKIVLEKKEKGHPKTYEECCEILGMDSTINHVVGTHFRYRDRIRSFIKLLICRDAYWKLYGEKMGLGKPWEPDYSGTFEHGTPIKYVIYNIGTHIVKERKSSPNHILSFPSAEMRDAFYENFKSEIEFCKELL